MWTDGNGFFYQGDCRPGDREASAEELAAWQATLPKVVSFDGWLSLFTADERAWAFASDHPNVREMIARGSAADAIDLTSAKVSSFLDLVIALGSPLTLERKAQVIAGETPA